MGGANLKRAIFVGLLLVLAGVWGHNLYRLLPQGGEAAPGRGASEGKAAPEPAPVEAYPPALGPAAGEDPFRPFFLRAETSASLIVEKVPEPILPPPGFAYLGLVKDKKRTCAVIRFGDGFSDVVGPREEVLGVKVLEFDEEKLRYRYRGGTFEAALEGSR